MGRLQDRLSRLTQPLDRDALLDALFVSHAQPMMIIDVQTQRYLAVNKAALAQYGYSEDEFFALHASQLRPPQDGPMFQDFIASLDRHSVCRRVWTHRRKDGSTFPVEVISHPLQLGEGHIRLLTVVDLTERQRTAAELRQQQVRYEALLRAQSDLGQGIGIVELRAQRWLFVNEALERIAGRSAAELLALPSYLELIPRQQREVLRQRLAARLRGEKVVDQYETLVERPSGEILAIEVAVKPIPTEGPDVQAMVLVRDIRERKKGEQAQLNAQKMESLAALAGGVAHDFNNLMSIILGNVDMASREVPLDSPVREWLRSIESAGLKAADIGQQMLAYSGKGHFVVQRLDLTQMLRELDEQLRMAAGTSARLELDVVEGALVDGDAQQLRQLVTNLVVNAAEAMGSNAGTIRVSVGVVDVDPERLAGMALGDELRPGPCVALTVEDTGSGMDAGTLAKVFDPFFTTRFTGRGLGLSAVFGIVRGHRGAIRVRSALGRGTSVEVLFPSVAQTRPEAAAASAPAREAAPRLVLVADDEEGVRSVVAKILERSGFDVLTAADGREAVELFEEHAARIAAAVLDMTMPVLGGEETLAEMRRRRPDVQVLMMSGFPEEEARLRFKVSGLVSFIRKPFMPDELREKVRRMLEDGAGR